ncbi:MAG: hypothetical protein ACRCZB_04265 [Bacteroidales bacterium]
MPIDYVLHEISYANMIMYSATLPSYNSSKKSEDGNVIDANDPRNIDLINRMMCE